MARQRFRFDPLIHVKAEAIGLPGKRSFYLLAADGKKALRVKVDKPQLEMLSLGVKQVLEQIPEGRAGAGKPAGEQQPQTLWPGEEEVAFVAGQLGIGYEESRDLIVLVLYDIEEASRRSPTFVGLASKDQMEALSQEIDAVCAAGRPLCPLCQLPMNPEGHLCPRSNGHAQLV